MADLNYQAMAFWWNVFLTICLVGMAIYQWVISRDRANAKDISEVRDLLQMHDSRLISIERDLRHMPSHHDIKQLTESLSRVHGDLSNAVGKLEGLGRAVDLVQQHLLDGSKRGH